MKEFKGKSCKIQIEQNGRRLFYNAKLVTSISDSHITFIDRYNDAFCYRVKDVVEIEGVP